MRKFLTVGVIVVCIVLATGFLYSYVVKAQAQTAVTASPSGAAARGAKMMDRLTQALSLTPDQVAKIKPILESSRSKMMELRNDSTLTDDQKKTEVRQIRMDEARQIEPLLTPDQIAKWKAMRSQMRAREGFGGGATAPGSAQ